MQQNKDGELKSYKLHGLFKLTFLLILLPSFLLASFEDFKRQQQLSFKEYSDERDAAFNSYLKAQWKEYRARESKPLYEKPKPKNITPKRAQKIKSVGPLVKVMLDKPQVEEPKKQEKKNKIIFIKKPDVEIKKEPKRDVAFNFFGEELGFDIDSTLKEAKFFPQSQKGISNFFQIVASGNYEDLLQEIQETSSRLALNDWGVYLLVKELSSSAYDVEDDARLFTWFLLNKLGYNVKVGLASKSVVLLHYSKKIIYSTPNYKFNNKSFYLLADYATRASKRVYTYKQDYPNAEKALDLSLKTLPNFKSDKREKTLHFKQLSKEFSIPVTFNQNLIDFMGTYPQADYETYFNSPLEQETYDEISKAIKSYIDGKRASVGINFVLNFVQSAFKYERDQEQFGREKVMFAQETLYYDKSDCEDRAILFSYLVKKLFSIGVVGIKYSDHMATGLYIPLQGDSVIIAGKKFVIADPTYLNANIGQSMPKYKSKIPQSFIVVKKDGV